MQNVFQTAIDKANETLVKARQIWGREFSTPAYSFQLKGRVAGHYRPLSRTVTFNPVLLKENEQTFLAQTVPHEIAHLITFDLFGRGVSAHGPEWKNVMRRLGLKPTRCHTYDVSNVSTSRRTVSMYCSCQEHKVSMTLVRRMNAGKRYLCRKCRTPIQSESPTLTMGARVPSQAKFNAPNFSLD